MANMTEISRTMAQNAFRAKTTDEAISILRENAQFRTLKDILTAADPQHDSEKELKKRIVEKLVLHHPDKKEESLERNVRNWFSGRVRTISREMAFELCLVLELSLEEANRFMMRVTEEAIHWRNPEEIVWGYAIVHKLSYEETMNLIAETRKILPEGSFGNDSKNVYTHLVRSEVLQQLQNTPEQLLSYIAENKDRWGAYHNTAYDLFDKYMRLLQNATPDTGEFELRKEQYEKQKKRDAEAKMDDALSVEDILDTYFFRKCVEPTTEMSILQRSIRMNWPDESTLSKMKNRAPNADVSRKVLILLFLATNGDSSEFQMEDDEEFDERRTRDRVFRDLYLRLNRMLSRCGFQTLDPRSPFDWMILFCICAEDIWETDRRLEEVLSGLFPVSEESGNEIKE